MKMWMFWFPFLPFNPFRPPHTREARLRDLESRMSEFIAAKRNQANNPVLGHVARERERVRRAIEKARGGNARDAKAPG